MKDKAEQARWQLGGEVETNVGRDGKRSYTVTEKPVSGGEGEKNFFQSFIVLSRLFLIGSLAVSDCWAWHEILEIRPSFTTVFLWLESLCGPQF